MEEKNITSSPKFLLLGFYEWPHFHLFLFVILLLVYVMALTGNMTIILVTYCSPNLHTPMYFFLCNLSIIDITLTSSIVPKLLDICLTDHNSITHLECFTQLLLFALCIVAEHFLLAVMAYDRFVAICCPLRYVSLMNLRISFHLAAISWAFGVLESLTITALISRCTFGEVNVVNHLFCDLESLLKLPTSGTNEAQMALLGLGFIGGFFPLVFILGTYMFVVYTILKIRSNEGKRKAFSTCSSHLTVITLFLGVTLRMYIRPNSAYVVEENKILCLLYTCFIPTLNPVIYSLRNKDVHLAIQKLKLSMHWHIVR